MWEDPIVAEVHRTREKLAAEHNYDIKAYFADLRKRQAALGARLVRQKQPNATPLPNEVAVPIFSEVKEHRDELLEASNECFPA